MTAFRLWLIVMIVALGAYTVIVIANHGMNLVPIFFSDIAKMGWPGQFNADFAGFLTLSALWLAWRHHFSPTGFMLGVLGLCGGIMFLAPYLLVASYKANGDVKELLLGKARTAS